MIIVWISIRRFWNGLFFISFFFSFVRPQQLIIWTISLRCSDKDKNKTKIKNNWNLNTLQLDAMHWPDKCTKNKSHEMKRDIWNHINFKQWMRKKKLHRFLLKYETRFVFFLFGLCYLLKRKTTIFTGTKRGKISNYQNNKNNEKKKIWKLRIFMKLIKK